MNKTVIEKPKQSHQCSILKLISVRTTHSMKNKAKLKFTINISKNVLKLTTDDS